MFSKGQALKIRTPLISLVFAKYLPLFTEGPCVFTWPAWGHSGCGNYPLPLVRYCRSGRWRTFWGSDSLQRPPWEMRRKARGHVYMHFIHNETRSSILSRRWDADMSATFRAACSADLCRNLNVVKNLFHLAQQLDRSEYGQRGERSWKMTRKKKQLLTDGIFILKEHKISVQDFPGLFCHCFASP